MAEEEKKVEGEEEKPKKGLPKLPIKLLAIIAGSVAGLVLVLVLVVMVAKSVKAPELAFGPEPPKQGGEAPLPLATFLVAPEFVAKLADKEEAHMVKTGEFRLAYDPKHKMLPTELEERQFQISDIINTIFMTKTAEDISSAEGKDELKHEIMNKINGLLREGQIEDIYVQLIVQ